MRTIATRMQFKDDRINRALRKIADKEQEMTDRLALAPMTPTAPAVTAEHLALVKATIAKDATPAELDLFLYDCARQGVHPLDKLIHFTKRGREGKYTPITSIDFMRIRAADSGECVGSDDATFTGTPMTAGFEAHVTVYRLVQGQRAPFTATARWTEYKPDQDFMWKRMPHLMLAKCAEALALRKAFPKQLAGLYVKEEMEQAGAGARPVTRPLTKSLTPSPGPAVLDAVIADPGLGVSAAPANLTATIPDSWQPFITNPQPQPLNVDPDRLRGTIVSGKRNKTKTTAVLSTGEEVTTLDPDLGAEVIAAKAAGARVEIVTRTTGVGKEIVSVTIVNDGAVDAAF